MPTSLYNSEKPAVIRPFHTSCPYILSPPVTLARPKAKLKATMSDGNIFKPDKDFTKEADKVIPEAQEIAKVGATAPLTWSID